MKFIHLFTFSTFLFLLFQLTNNIQPSSNFQSNNLKSINSSFPFQKIIWTYWNNDKQQTPIIVQACIQNLAIVCKKHNFTFVYLNNSNLRNYINNYDQVFTQVRKKSVQKLNSQIADLIRILVLQQHGGIWVDSTTIFPNGLTQILNIANDEYRNLIVNRFSQQPQALLFYFSVGQNRIQQKITNPNNPNSTILFNEFPDYEGWAMFAKKNSSFLSYARKVYSELTTIQFLQAEKRFIKEDIYINQIDDSRQYLYIDMAFDYTLQLKQKQLDKQLTLFGQRKYCFQHYKLWGLHGEYGPQLTTRDDLIKYQHYFWYSTEQFQKRGFKFRFFIKHFGPTRQITNKFFKAIQQNFGHNNHTFEQFMKSNPSKQTCNSLVFVVQNSIMANLLTNSTVLQKHRIPIITKQQNEQYLNYCQKRQSFLSKIFKFIKPYYEKLIMYKNSYYKISRAKVESILRQKQNLNLYDKINIWINDNGFLIFDFGYLSIITLILAITYYILSKVLSPVLNSILLNDKKPLKINITKIIKSKNFQNQLHQQNQITNLKYQQNIQNQSCQTDTNKHHKIFYFYYFLLYFIVLLNMVMYNAVDVTCGKQQPIAIFFTVLITFFIQSFIEKKLSQTHQAHSSYIKYHYELFYIMINYLVTFLALTHVFRNRFWLNWCAQVLGMIGPCIYKIKEQLKFYKNIYLSSGQVRKINNTKQNIGLKDFDLQSSLRHMIKNNWCRLIVLSFMLINILIPNIKYLCNGQQYYIRYIPLLPLAYLCILYVPVIYECIRKSLKYEIIKLILLPVIVLRLYLTIYQYYDLVVKTHRMSFIIMTIVILTFLYLIIGSSIKFQTKKINLCLNKNYNQVFSESIINIVPCLCFIIIGYILIDHGKTGWNMGQFWIQYVIFCYSNLVSIIYGTIQTQNNQQNFLKINQSQLTEFKQLNTQQKLFDSQ